MSEDLDVSMKCVQYMLFVSNFLFVMVALLLISIGTIIKTMYTDFEYFLDASYFSPSDLIIFSGFVIFFVAFFGCWGAMKESTLLVNVYAFLLLVILVLEVLAAVIALFMRVDLQSTITENMFDVFNTTKSDHVAADVFDFTQSQLYCCGVKGPFDWINGTSNSNNSLPASCCPGYNYFDRSSNITCKLETPGTFSGPKPYSKSCAYQVTELVSQTAYLLTTGAFCVAFIQVVGIVFARLLSNTIRNIKTQRLVEAELRRQQIYSQIILGASMNGESDSKPHNTETSEA